MTATLTQKFWDLEKDLNGVVLERFEEIHGANLALITKEHHFTLGSPGIAKTMLPDQLVKRIAGLKEDDYFSVLLMKSTPTEELFGVYDMQMLMESVYKRMTKGKLPNAKFATIDECFKGSAATLNGLLWMLNERWFKNHDEDKVRPLMTAFLMSNELAENEGLHAMWDRLLFRFYAQPISDTSNFMKMLTATVDETPDTILSVSDIEAAIEQAKQVHVPDNVLIAIKQLKEALIEKGITVTDRRWRKVISVIRAEAWMRGNEEVDISDLRPLAHVLWDDTNQLATVQAEVRNLADPDEAKAVDLLDEISSVYAKYLEQRGANEDRATRTKAGLLMFKKYKSADKEYESLKDKVDSRRSDVMVRLRRKLDTINTELSANLEVDSDEGFDK